MHLSPKNAQRTVLSDSNKSKVFSNFALLGELHSAAKEHFRQNKDYARDFFWRGTFARVLSRDRNNETREDRERRGFIVRRSVIKRFSVLKFFLENL